MALRPDTRIYVDDLRSLSLPSFDPYILCYRFAFGLRHIQLGNARLGASRGCVTALTTSVDLTNQPFLFPMPSLSPTPTQDTFAHIAETLLPNLMTLQGLPRLIIHLTSSRPLIDASIIVSKTIHAGFRPTTTRLESLPPSLRHLIFKFKFVGKRTEEKTLRSAIVVCPAIEELEIEGDAGEACWCSIVPHFKSLRDLAMRKPGTAQRTSARSSSSGVQWHRPLPSLSPLPRSQSSPCLPFDDLFVKKINRDVVPPPPPRKVVPLTEQRFMKREECFDLNDSDDDDSLFYKPSLRKDSSSMQGCQEQIEVDVRGAGTVVMALV
ncbi:hypothetical protein EDD18DRAFT_1112444 [Armillaria luteobubalina]|uniref:Uncharacterized protein n=1 Tax=Armillaria luteobubalina TaxID=153913 RepID=A0AA39PEX1_9AGAR|nr:hypothetical protein EDD18DRAFT_1112444 [Armillaria luteobubalina]